MNLEEVQYAELAYEETTHYATWKRTVENLIGRVLDPIEATEAYDMIDKGQRESGIPIYGERPSGGFQ